jgi:hypothetical protein
MVGFGDVSRDPNSVIGTPFSLLNVAIYAVQAKMAAQAFREQWTKTEAKRHGGFYNLTFLDDTSSLVKPLDFLDLRIRPFGGGITIMNRTGSCGQIY